MKPEQLMEAFQYLDDDIIEAVEISRRNPVTKDTPFQKLFSAANSIRFQKLLTTAACLCLILTAILFIPRLFGETDTSSDMAMDENDNYMTESSLNSLTLPDYEGIRYALTNDEWLNSFEFSRSNADEDGLAHSETTEDEITCTEDVLPVYHNLDIRTAIFTWDDLAVFEQQLKIRTSYDIYGQYSSIDFETAQALLDEGKYLTFTDTEEPMEDNGSTVEEYYCEMVYIYDKESDLAIPYYRFSHTDLSSVTSEKEYYLLYDGYFVPAIAEECITNMPSANSDN